MEGTGMTEAVSELKIIQDLLLSKNKKLSESFNASASAVLSTPSSAVLSNPLAVLSTPPAVLSTPPAVLSIPPSAVLSAPSSTVLSTPSSTVLSTPPAALSTLYPAVSCTSPSAVLSDPLLAVLSTPFSSFSSDPTLAVSSAPPTVLITPSSAVSIALSSAVLCTPSSAVSNAPPSAVLSTPPSVFPGAPASAVSIVSPLAVLSLPSSSAAATDQPSLSAPPEIVDDSSNIVSLFEHRNYNKGAAKSTPADRKAILDALREKKKTQLQELEGSRKAIKINLKSVEISSPKVSDEDSSVGDIHIIDGPIEVDPIEALLSSSGKRSEISKIFREIKYQEEQASKQVQPDQPHSPTDVVSALIKTQQVNDKDNHKGKKEDSTPSLGNQSHHGSPSIPPLITLNKSKGVKSKSRSKPEETDQEMKKEKPAKQKTELPAYEAELDNISDEESLEEGEITDEFSGSEEPKKALEERLLVAGDQRAKSLVTLNWKIFTKQDFFINNSMDLKQFCHSLTDKFRENSEYDVVLILAFHMSFITIETSIVGGNKVECLKTKKDLYIPALLKTAKYNHEKWTKLYPHMKIIWILPHPIDTYRYNKLQAKEIPKAWAKSWKKLDKNSEDNLLYWNYIKDLVQCWKLMMLDIASFPAHILFFDSKQCMTNYCRGATDLPDQMLKDGIHASLQLRLKFNDLFEHFYMEKFHGSSREPPNKGQMSERSLPAGKKGSSYFANYGDCSNLPLHHKEQLTIQRELFSVYISTPRVHPLYCTQLERYTWYYETNRLGKKSWNDFWLQFLHKDFDETWNRKKKELTLAFDITCEEIRNLTASCKLQSDNSQRGGSDPDPVTVIRSSPESYSTKKKRRKRSKSKTDDHGSRSRSRNHRRKNHKHKSSSRKSKKYRSRKYSTDSNSSNNSSTRAKKVQSESDDDSDVECLVSKTQAQLKEIEMIRVKRMLKSDNSESNSQDSTIFVNKSGSCKYKPETKFASIGEGFSSNSQNINTTESAFESPMNGVVEEGAAQVAPPSVGSSDEVVCDMQDECLDEKLDMLIDDPNFMNDLQDFGDEMANILNDGNVESDEVASSRTESPALVATAPIGDRSISISDQAITFETFKKKGSHLTEVLRILSNVASHFGPLAASIVTMHRKALEYIENGKDPNTLLTKSNMSVLEVVDGKLAKFISDTAIPDSYRALYKFASKELREVLDSPSSSCGLFFGVNISNIAKATVGCDTSRVINFIKNTLLYHGLGEVPVEDVMRVFMAVKTVQLRILETSSTGNPP